jgi:predicted nucleic acid-binding OB-fold protein
MIQTAKKTTMWIIPPEGLIQEREIDACPEYAELSEIVGGMIEIVRVVVDGIETELICNENGTFLFDLPENPRALSRVDHTDALMPHLYGTVIIFSEPTVI